VGLNNVEDVSSSSDKLERFGVSMPAGLLEQFDSLVTKRGYSNRSEAIRDLVRDTLVDAEWEAKSHEVVGVVTLVYVHNVRDTSDRLVELQHHHHTAIMASMHIHLDEAHCLEVVTVRGEPGEVREIADHLISMRGVVHGRFVATTTGQGIG
jgi:CopG family nickel-responsive transcriptional regulator